MKVIAGLGNPGREYAQTKHNVGFLMVDALAAHLGVTEWREKYDALIARARIGSEAVLLVKPQTYMNESGRAIAPLMNFYKLAADDFIVAHDDMDIPVGSIRIRKKGVPAGIMASNRFLRIWGMSISLAYASASAVLCLAGRS